VIGLGGLQDAVKVYLGAGAGEAEVEGVLQDFEDVGRHEGGRVGPDGDAFDTEAQEGEEDGDGFLFEPTDHQRQG